MSSYKRSLALMLITFLVFSAFSSTTSRASDNTPSVPPRPKHNTPTAAIDPAALSAALSLAGKQSGTIPVMVQLTVPSTSEMHAAARWRTARGWPNIRPSLPTVRIVLPMR